MGMRPIAGDADGRSQRLVDPAAPGTYSRAAILPFLASPGNQAVPHQNLLTRMPPNGSPMTRLSTLTLMVLGSLPLYCGCGTMRGESADAPRAITSHRLKPPDYADPTEQSSDPWIHQAGAEARGNRPKEKSVEPEWFTNLLRSPKAREIENNLGIE